MGDFNFTKNQLVTDKLVGNLRGCIGFVKQGNYYVPNTLLQGDIRDITYKTNSIVCIIEKKLTDKNYVTLRYLKKEKVKKKNVKGEKIIIPAIGHIEGVCKLDIVQNKVDRLIFENIEKENFIV